MLVSIGSRSIPKITAITRAISRYPELWVDKDDKIEYIIMPKDVRNDEKIGLTGTNSKFSFSYLRHTIGIWNRPT